MSASSQKQTLLEFRVSASLEKRFPLMSAMPEENAASDLGITLSLRGDPDIAGQVPQVLHVLEDRDNLRRQFVAGVHVKPPVGGVDVTRQGRAFGNLVGR